MENGSDGAAKRAPEGGSSFALTVRRAALLRADVWTDERISVIVRTIAPEGAGTAEVAMFLAVADRYNLDPFAKEIWLAKDKGRLIILTGKDAILKVARSHPEYAGYEGDLVYEKDEFRAERSKGDVQVVHKITGFDRGALVGAYCLARKEGHPPVLVTRRWDQYAHLHGKDNWKAYGPDMLLSRVVTAAHRLLYNISGMYTAEEVDSGEALEDLAAHEVAQKTRSRLQSLKAEIAAGPGPDAEEVPYEVVEAPPEPAPPPPPPVDEPDPVTEHQKALGAFWSRYRESYDVDDMDHEEARRRWLEKHFGKRSISQMSTGEVRRARVLLDEGDVPELEPAEPAGQGGMPV